MESAENGRLEWLDIMKAILIILMVMGHSTTPFVTYVYLFHMGAFFIISGYTYSGEKYCLKDFLKRKALIFIVPTISVNIIYNIFYCVMQKTGMYGLLQAGDSVSFSERMRQLLRFLNTADLGGATWFLFVLFEVEILFKFFSMVAYKLNWKGFFWVLVGTAGITGYWLVCNHKILPYQFDLALLACIYYGAGVAAAKLKLQEELDIKIMIPFSIIITLFFGHSFFSGTMPMNWPTRSFANLFLQLLSVFAATYLVWYVATILMRTKSASLLQWIGRHTYCILIIHFAVFRMIFAVGVYMGKMPASQLQKLTPELGVSQNGGWLYITLCTVIICCFIAYFSEKNRWTNFFINARLSKK